MDINKGMLENKQSHLRHIMTEFSKLWTVNLSLNTWNMLERWGSLIENTTISTFQVYQIYQVSLLWYSERPVCMYVVQQLQSTIQWSMLCNSWIIETYFMGTKKKEREFFREWMDDNCWALICCRNKIIHNINAWQPSHTNFLFTCRHARAKLYVLPTTGSPPTYPNTNKQGLDFWGDPTVTLAALNCIWGNFRLLLSWQNGPWRSWWLAAAVRRFCCVPFRASAHGF